MSEMVKFADRFTDYVEDALSKKMDVVQIPLKTAYKIEDILLLISHLSDGLCNAAKIERSEYDGPSEN